MQNFRARTSSAWGWSAIVLGIIVAAFHVLTVGFAYASGGLGLGLAAILVGWAAFLRPHVAVLDDAVEVHNVTHVATLAYARLGHLETKWSLEVVGDDARKVSAFAAPATSVRNARSARETVPDFRRDPARDAADLVTAASSAWTQANPHPVPADGPSIARRLDWIGATAIVVATIAALWGLFG